MKDMWFGVALIFMILFVMTNASWIYSQYELAELMKYWRDRCTELEKQIRSDKK